MSFLDMSPELAQVFILTMMDQQKSSLLVSTLVEKSSQICNGTIKLKDLMVIPAGSNVDIDAFQTKLCSVNFNKIPEELLSMLQQIPGMVNIYIYTYAYLHMYLGLEF